MRPSSKKSRSHSSLLSVPMRTNLSDSDDAFIIKRLVSEKSNPPEINNNENLLESIVYPLSKRDFLSKIYRKKGNNYMITVFNQFDSIFFFIISCAYIELSERLHARP